MIEGSFALWVSFCLLRLKAVRSRSSSKIVMECDNWVAVHSPRVESLIPFKCVATFHGLLPLLPTELGGAYRCGERICLYLLTSTSFDTGMRFVDWRSVGRTCLDLDEEKKLNRKGARWWDSREKNNIRVDVSTGDTSRLLLIPCVKDLLQVPVLYRGKTRKQASSKKKISNKYGNDTCLLTENLSSC